MIIFLMGFMTSGKTSFGKKLARSLEYDFLDLDEIIEDNQKMSINHIFETKGEVYFRNLETEVLINILNNSNNENRVVALGGGTPCFNKNIELIKEKGIVIYLELPLKIILGRLKADKEKRPLVKNLEDDALVEKVTAIFNEREAIYQQSHLVLNAQESASKLKIEVSNFIENQR